MPAGVGFSINSPQLLLDLGVVLDRDFYKGVVMYGHEIIEKLYSDVKQFEISDIYNLISDIKKSECFHFGDIDEEMGKIYMSASKTFKECTVDNKLNLPYPNCCFEMSAPGNPNGANKSAYLVWDNDTHFKIREISGNDWMQSPVVWLIEKIGGNLSHKVVDEMRYYFRVEDEHRFDDLVLHTLKTRWFVAELTKAFILLLNAKNITTIDNPPPAKLNKKRIKNGKQPLFTYKTLRLQLPAKKRKKGSGPAMATDNTTRLHLCRGHFKTYTAEKPLLGKFTGRYWWQPHARGDKAKGMVVKDYLIDVG